MVQESHNWRLKPREFCKCSHIRGLAYVAYHCSLLDSDTVAFDIAALYQGGANDSEPARLLHHCRVIDDKREASFSATGCPNELRMSSRAAQSSGW